MDIHGTFDMKPLVADVFVVCRTNMTVNEDEVKLGEIFVFVDMVSTNKRS